jgi:hypothetical protein
MKQQINTDASDKIAVCNSQIIAEISSGTVARVYAVNAVMDYNMYGRRRCAANFAVGSTSSEVNFLWFIYTVEMANAEGCGCETKDIGAGPLSVRT